MVCASTILSHSMIAARRLPSTSSRQHVRTIQSLAASQSKYGRPPVLRRLGVISQTSPILHPSRTHSPSSPLSILSTSSAQRSLHTSRILQQQAQAKQEPPQEDVKDPPRPDGKETEETEAKPDTKSDETKAEDAKSEEAKSEDGEGKKDDKTKEAPPPPPPHGDKTPWQVFRETFSTELKKSNEFNESTKQLAGEIQDFRESERVKKASAAYDATVGRAARGAGQAITGTAKAVGHGAAWTWDTSVVQGVRKGVNATGRGIEQITRPVRETETFKNVKDAIDEGNASRYGGWTEKEERRLRRAQREAKEGIRRVEPAEEDPKYVKQVYR